MQKFKSKLQALSEWSMELLIVVLGFLAFTSIALAVMQLIRVGGMVYMD